MSVVAVWGIQNAEYDAGFCIFESNVYIVRIMETVILKLDMRSKSAKALKDLIMEMSKDNKGIKVEKSPYDPDFVKMVKKSAASKNRTEIDPKNVWASIEWPLPTWLKTT